MQNSELSTAIKKELELIHLSLDLDRMSVSIDISLFFFLVFLIVPFVFWIVRFRKNKYELVKLNIKLGNIGEAEIIPNEKDIQIAHCIWTELVTRKAAIPFDVQNDVLIEVYDSWYSIFVKVRELISAVPANLIRKEKSTQEIVRIATTTLNAGLRPHLTKWQSNYRNWYKTNSVKLDSLSPQELQREFPQYSELVSEIIVINTQLMEYAAELKKIIDG